MTSPVSAVDPASAAAEVIGAEGGQKVTKEAIDAVLKIDRSKPVMTATTGIVCIACGILIAKT